MIQIAVIIMQTEEKTKRKITSLKSRIEIRNRQGGKCKICHKMLGYRYHIDHIQPLCLGGCNESTNLQALCLVCHDNKSFLELMLFHQQKYGRCMWCYRKLLSASLEHHVCVLDDIKIQEKKWEEKTGQSKYFIPHTFSFHQIQYPKMIQTPTHHFHTIFTSVFHSTDDSTNKDR